MRCRTVTSIDIFPNDVLLEIFDFYVIEERYVKRDIEAWQTLLHVCRQWRSVVFGSPRRLNLRLYCETEAQTPLRDTLDVWPALPLIIQGSANRPEKWDNILAALERSGRVRRVYLMDISSWHLENVSTAMQRPFPELICLCLSSREVVTVVPDSAFGGTTPRLRSLDLHGIPFPGLPKLLLSANHLDFLSLTRIPHSGYFSPEALVTALSTLTCLDWLFLEFQSPQSLPDRESRRPPPLTRCALPILRLLSFTGVSEYLEDLVARIDTPRLRFLEITLFNQIVFDTPQTIQFIRRTPALEGLEVARLAFHDDIVMVSISSTNRELEVGISCRELDWQVSSLEQVFTSILPPLSALKNLYIHENPDSPPDWKDNIENMLWLEVLLPFSSVENLYLAEKFAQYIAPVLQELVGGRTTEVLPALKNIFLEGFPPFGPVHKGIVAFVAARELSHHPVTVSPWERDLDSETFSSSEEDN